MAGHCGGTTHSGGTQENTSYGFGADIGGDSAVNEFSMGSADEDPIVLVDARDVPQGIAPKIEVHRRGLKHRAISVLVRNHAGDYEQMEYACVEGEKDLQHYTEAEGAKPKK